MKNKLRRVELLEEWLKREKEKVVAEGKAFFLDLPDAWYEPPHWCCSSGHVSNRFLKSEAKGALCLACSEPVYLCPEITEEELNKIINP